MNQTTFEIANTRFLTADTFALTLTGDTSSVTAPGQFVNIALPGFFLRRPVSICDWDDGRLLLLIKIAGRGTAELSRLAPGTRLDVLCGLGNGFSLPRVTGNPILAGGGIGIAPLYALAKAMLAAREVPMVALGYRSKEESFFAEEFRALGCEVLLATEDGSLGEQGFVTDLIRTREERDYVLTCGPLPMLRAVYDLPQLLGGQFSFEARMGCGFGACMGCSLPTAGGMKRVCADGPVFFREEIVW